MKSRRLGSRTTTLWACLTAIALVLLTLPAAAVPVQADNPEPRQSRERGPKLITEEDINLIRVFEVDLDTEKPPTIKISRSVLRDFLEKYKAEDGIPRGRKAQADWLKLDGHEQLPLLFKVRAREYYKDVRIASPIESLKQWGGLHRRYILGYFFRHFGEGQVEGFRLIPQGQEGDRIEMTNFYILTQTKIDGRRMIDRDTPEDSLILQWGLPRDDAKFAAPDVKRWQPYFRGPDDERYQETLKWIELLIRANQDSDYGISYELPGRERRERRDRREPDDRN